MTGKNIVVEEFYHEKYEDDRDKFHMIKGTKILEKLGKDSVTKVAFSYDPVKGGVDVRGYGISFTYLAGFQMLPSGIGITSGAALGAQNQSAYYFYVEKKVADFINLDSWQFDESKYQGIATLKNGQTQTFNVTFKMTYKKRDEVNEEAPTLHKDQVKYENGVLTLNDKIFKDPDGMKGVACRVHSLHYDIFTTSQNGVSMPRCQTVYYYDALSPKQKAEVASLPAEEQKTIKKGTVNTSFQAFNDQLAKNNGVIDLNSLFTNSKNAKHYQENGVKIVLRGWDQYDRLTKTVVRAFPGNRLEWGSAGK